MGSWTKTLEDAKNNPRNVRFSDLCGIAERAGFVLSRQKGSHRSYRHPAHPQASLTLQGGKDGKSPPYQVRQVLEALETYKLEVK